MSEDLLKTLISSIAPIITALAFWRQSSSNKAQGQPSPAAAPPSNEDSHPQPAQARRERKRRGMTLLIGAVASVAVVVLVWVLFDDGNDDVLKHVTVPGTVLFTDTGIDLERGDRVDISATGSVFHSPHDSARASPDGVAQRYPTSVLPDENHGALIGRIGSEGQAFVAGSRWTYVAPQSGRLYLGVNDTGVQDNRGKFDVVVDVDRN